MPRLRLPLPCRMLLMQHQVWQRLRGMQCLLRPRRLLQQALIVSPQQQEPQLQQLQQQQAQGQALMAGLPSCLPCRLGLPQAWALPPPLRPPLPPGHCQLALPPPGLAATRSVPRTQRAP